MYTFCIRSKNFGKLWGGVLTNLITRFNTDKPLVKGFLEDSSFLVCDDVKYGYYSVRVEGE